MTLSTKTLVVIVVVASLVLAVALSGVNPIFRTAPIVNF